MAKVSKMNIRESSTFSEAKLFLRMLALSGCFWVIGIIAVFAEIVWLEYVFTVLCGLQGLLVTVANLTTRRMDCFKCGQRSTTQDIYSIADN